MTISKGVLFSSLVALAVYLNGFNPCRAGSPPIGVVARGVQAMVSGQPTYYDTALFNSDKVQVKDGGLAIVKLTRGGVVVLHSQTVASFSREEDGVDVELDHGSISMVEPLEAKPLGVRAAGVFVEPVRGFKTLGDVALLNNRLSVTAREGRIRLEGRGIVTDIAKGKTITLNIAGGDAPPTGAAVSAGLLGSHAARIAAVTAAGGTGAGVGLAAAVASHGSAVAAIGATTFASETKPAVGNGGEPGESDGDDHNPTAVGNVASHVPPQACNHAASQSVPAEACSGDSDDQ
jgi:hypothetical protein